LLRDLQGSLVGAGLWLLACLALYSVLEGHWGWSPGKAALGIRIKGRDLKACGFSRALLRNALKAFDALFFFLVGILLVACTRNWQRLGDLLGGTVVIRVR